MFNLPEVFEVAPLLVPATTSIPEIQNLEEKKKKFGVELAKTEPFKAACEVFEDTKIALWAIANLQNDPIVIASKDQYLKTVNNSAALIDKDELAIKVLKFAEEQNASKTFYLVDAKDRLAAYKLYAELRGYLNNKDVGNTNYFINNNGMTITLVEPEQQIRKEKVIEGKVEEIQNQNSTVLTLVG